MKDLTPIKAIRAKCLECACKRPSEVRKCESYECPLFPYRMGKNPKRKGISSKFCCSSKKNISEIVVSDPNEPGCVYKWVPCNTKKKAVE